MIEIARAKKMSGKRLISERLRRVLHGSETEAAIVLCEPAGTDAIGTSDRADKGVVDAVGRASRPPSVAGGERRFTPQRRRRSGRGDEPDVACERTSMSETSGLAELHLHEAGCVRAPDLLRFLS
jgi:hypothetical protein